MKKTILALAVIMTTVLTNAFADKNEGIAQRAMASFKKDFTSAKNVSWEQQKVYAKATFSLNNQVLYAYYDLDGELLAVIRNILSDQLPVKLLTELKKDYANGWITELFEVSTENQTTYYVTLETSDSRVILKSEPSNNWSVYKREKKNCVEL